MKCAPGDPVTLDFRDGVLSVFIDGVCIDSVRDVPDFNLASLIRGGAKYEAFISERDMKASNPNYMDFLSIIVFYRMD